MDKTVCSHCVMDITDREICFNESGVCDHCLAYKVRAEELNIPEKINNKAVDQLFADIKKQGKNQKYDCIIGLSGGVDSSYIAILASQYGLRPLCVHLDNGWNSELSVANIHSIVQKLNFDLYTHVIDWDEFKDLQRSFFKANVIDIELLSDHAIFGVIMQVAKKHNIKAILSGANFSTEFIMPRTWVHRKQDLTNIRDIQNKFGTRKIKTFPQVSTFSHVLAMYIQGFKVLKPLNLINYDKKQTKQMLMDKIGWRDYGGKHHESLFTKFYQAHILPTKFNVDKRKAHLSTLICSGQVSRDQALTELKAPIYNPNELPQDYEFVCKKLDFTSEEMANYLKQPPVPHSAYKSDQWVYDALNWFKNKFKLSL